MDIGQLILDALRSEYKNGATQTEMARRHGIPQSYMQRLLAGTRPAGGISIDTFQRMFPNAVIDLQGAVVGDNHGIVNGVKNSGDKSTLRPQQKQHEKRRPHRMTPAGNVASVYTFTDRARWRYQWENPPILTPQYTRHDFAAG